MDKEIIYVWNSRFGWCWAVCNMDPIKKCLRFMCFGGFLYNLLSFFCFSAAPKQIKVTNGSGKTGTTTELSCTYDGRPLPTIKWLGFGKDLNQVSDINLSGMHINENYKSFANLGKFFGVQ